MRITFPAKFAFMRVHLSTTKSCRNAHPRQQIARSCIATKVLQTRNLPILDLDRARVLCSAALSIAGVKSCRCQMVIALVYKPGPLALCKAVALILWPYYSMPFVIQCIMRCANTIMDAVPTSGFRIWVTGSTIAS